MVVYDNYEYLTEEEKRLREDRHGGVWKRWGPYVAERQWATVREDYSADGDAWSYFPHEHARARTYRWGEDGIAGVSDNKGFQNIAFVFWNGKDSILKERLFGLSNPQGNHGESIKEAHFHVDNTPTHSYMKFLYKYPQCEFPYDKLVAENARRGKQDREYQIIDTGVFEDDRYWDIFIETAKDDDAEELLFRVTAWNRGPERAPLHILPHVWFRNTWSWGREAADKKPSIELVADNMARTSHHKIGERYVLLSPSPGVGSSGNDVDPVMLFTENDTNFELLYGGTNPQPYVKDAFHRRVIGGEHAAVNPANTGTKFAAWFTFDEDGGVAPGECAVVRFRVTRKPDGEGEGGFLDEEVFDDTIDRRRAEADDFYFRVSPLPMSDDLRNIQRQAFAGMMWCKQHYYFVWDQWANGDPAQPPPPPSRKAIRNSAWRHMYCNDVLSMPDSWEYPFFAAWDTAFHAIVLAMIDPDFAKGQLDLFTREWYLHPNGQIPAYEWNFSDVNPPVHAWATFRVFKIERRLYGRQDLDFLERVFQKLLLNFTWWVNRKDADGKNVFEGGFLGLDNIGLFNRSEPLPTGGVLEQADSTGWMAFYCLSMLNIALELAKYRRTYEDIASKFFEHFILISDAMTFRTGQKDETSLWNEQDGFYYDAIAWGGPWIQQLPIRSLVGLIPLFATLTLEPELINKLPSFKRRVEWFIENRCDIAERNMASIRKRGKGNRILLSIVSRDRLEKILRRMLDEDEFLSPHGIRSLSKFHEANPVSMDVQGERFTVQYIPGDSDSGLFGGNSNWRGPIWLCVNFLLIESLKRFHLFYGNGLQIECPTGSGDLMHLGHVSEELQHRLQHLFVRDDEDRRAINGRNDTLDFDPYWKDYLWFYEFFDGDSGRGLGATHQCGWTGLIARLIHDTGISCRLPHTPRTPGGAMSHYFDDILDRFDRKLSIPNTPKGIVLQPLQPPQAHAQHQQSPLHPAHPLSITSNPNAAITSSSSSAAPVHPSIRRSSTSRSLRNLDQHESMPSSQSALAASGVRRARAPSVAPDDDDGGRTATVYTTATRSGSFATSRRASDFDPAATYASYEDEFRDDDDDDDDDEDYHPNGGEAGDYFGRVALDRRRSSATANDSGNANDDGQITPGPGRAGGGSGVENGDAQQQRRERLWQRQRRRQEDADAHLQRYVSEQLAHLKQEHGVIDADEEEIEATA